MKTLYEKAQKISSYVRDLMYMQRYYMDIYSNINVRRSINTNIIPSTTADKIRGYAFETTNPDEKMIYQILKRETDYSRTFIITLTSSYVHIKNNTNCDNPKYKYVQYGFNNVGDYGRQLPVDLRDLFHALRNAISTDTIRETEFQVQMLHDDYLITGYYMMMLLNDDLNNIQYPDKDVVLCLGSTDILTLIPARKAFIDLLDKRAPNDWRNTIQVRYGHTIG